MSEENGNSPIVEGAAAAPGGTPLRRRLGCAVRHAATAALLPVAWLANLRAAHIPILAYHRVLPNFPPGSPGTASIDPACFAVQLEYLVRKGYVTLSLEGLGRIVAGLEPPPRRAVALTFDDGYADNYKVAYMIGQEYGVTINFFIPTGIVGMVRWPHVRGERTLQELWHIQRYPELWRPLSWDEVRLMRRGGACFGCHGFLHRCLAELDARGLEDEIGKSAAAFQYYLGDRPAAYSLPCGEGEAARNAALPVIKAHGIGMVFMAGGRRVRLPFSGAILPRILVDEHDSVGTLVCKIQGAQELLEGWMGR